MRKQTSPFCGYVKQAAYFAWPFSYLAFIFAFEIAASSDTGALPLAPAPDEDSGGTRLMAHLSENTTAFVLFGCFASLQPT